MEVAIGALDLLPGDGRDIALREIVPHEAHVLVEPLLVVR